MDSDELCILYLAYIKAFAILYTATYSTSIEIPPYPQSRTLIE
jgi:hypothetical protein